MRKLLKDKTGLEIAVAIIRKVGLFINKGLYLICCLFPIDDKLILMESEGDYCDNSFALYETMLQYGLDKTYKIVWAAKDIHSKPSSIKRVISKNNTIPNFARALCLARTKYCIYDHQNIMEPYKKRKGQYTVFLSHGCGFKASKGRMLKKSIIDVMYATSPLFYRSASNFAGCDESKLRDMGLPRNDYLLRTPSSEEKKLYESFGFGKYEYVIFWMPTFRSSIVKSISEDYILGETGLPILYTHTDLESLNDLLSRMKAICVIKVHHLQAKLPVFQEKFSNIRVLLDDEIRHSGLQLYQIIKYSDALITDYSSVATDYYLLNKPIIYTLDDFEKYMNSRGFYPDNPMKYFVGYHAYNKADLFLAIEKAKNDNEFLGESSQIKKLMHSHVDNYSGKRILDNIGIL